MTGSKLSHINGDTIRTALEGFALSLVPEWNYDSLASEIRERLERASLPRLVDPDRPSNAEIRDSLLGLSKAVSFVRQSIDNTTGTTDNLLVSTSFKHDGFVNFIGFALASNSSYTRYHRAVSQLPFLSEFLRIAADDVEPQAHRWREREAKELRIERAELLLPIFESAFGRQATVNNAPNTEPFRGASPFMVFYQRIVGLAFDEHATRNLPEILKAARKHAKLPVMPAGAFDLPD